MTNLSNKKTSANRVDNEEARTNGQIALIIFTTATITGLKEKNMKMANLFL